MAPPPPPLIDDVIAEILLRLPPDEPACLFRASLVCKPWLRILCDPDFPRRYRAFHRTPPLLGLFERCTLDRVLDPHLVPTTAVPAFPYPPSGSLGGSPCSRAFDCRHGRVLLHNRNNFLVWDPATGDHHSLPSALEWSTNSAVVLCAVDGCDHVDCHGSPFLVILVAADSIHEPIKARVYSSETGAWSTPASPDLLDNSDEHFIQPRRAVLIGDELFFTIGYEGGILKHDWRKNRLSLISPPPVYYEVYHPRQIALMVTDDSSLGFIEASDFKLYLSSRKVNAKGVAEWVQFRVIDLDAVIPDFPVDCCTLVCVAGFAEGVGVIFVTTYYGLFMIQLKSGRAVKVCERDVEIYSILPFMRFYTPDPARLSLLARIG